MSYLKERLATYDQMYDGGELSHETFHKLRLHAIRQDGLHKAAQSAPQVRVPQQVGTPQPDPTITPLFIKVVILLSILALGIVSGIRMFTAT